MRLLLPFLALYRRHWFLASLGIVMTTLTLLAAVGLLALSGWFLAGSALAGSSGLYSFNYLLPAAGVRGAAIIRTAGRYVERVVSHDATFRILAHLRLFAFQKILPLSPGGIARFRQSEILNCFVADVDTLDHLYLRIITPLVAAMVIIFTVTFGLSLLDINMALTLGAILLGLLLLLPVIFYHIGKPIGSALTDLRALYRSALTSWLQGQAELLVFSTVERFHTKLANIEQHWLVRQQQQASLSAFSQALMILATGLTLILLLWLAAENINFIHTVSNDQASALIAFFVFAAIAAFEALSPVTGAFLHLGQVITAAKRVTHLIKQQPAVTFPSTVISSPISSLITLEMKQVSFTYPDQPLPVLQAISLSLAAGEHIALLGRTGCGKSTLLQLLTRAWDPPQGHIYINKQPITHFDESTLRRIMVVVSQRIHIFSDTLRANLLLAAPSATDIQLQKVLNQVGLQNLLANDEGLNAWLGEGGRGLSGGEQRRLGIARALLHSAPLWLLDEPTDGLDAETEQQIFSLLRQHCQRKSLILITHRLYGLETMDRICVMDGGRIVEQGDHQSLLKNKGRYYQLRKRYGSSHII